MGPDFAAVRGLRLVSGPQFPLPISESRCKRCAREWVPRGMGSEGLIGPCCQGGQLRQPQPVDMWGPSLSHGSAQLPTDPRGAHSRATSPRPLPQGPAPRDEVPPSALPIPRLASPAVQSWDDPNRVLDCPRPADPEPGLQGNSQARRLLGNKGPTGRLRPVLRMRQSPLRCEGRSPKKRWAGFPAPAQWAFFQIQGCEPTSPPYPMLHR